MLSILAGTLVDLVKCWRPIGGGTGVSHGVTGALKEFSRWAAELDAFLEDNGWIVLDIVSLK